VGVIAAQECYDKLETEAAVAGVYKHTPRPKCCVIEFIKVTKKYYALTALKDVSLTIPSGEVLGLLGPNGAGKTTLIKLIAGIIMPTEGQIRSIHPTGKWPSIGYKPERLVFPGNLVVSQYLEMTAGLSSSADAQRDNVVLESLARVNLLPAARKQIRTLSKGMRQRLGLAQALIGDPDLLLLDEPSSGLDPDGQEEMLSYIEELRLSGKTILMSSHLLPEVTRACTTLVILKDGRMLYQNRVSDALTFQPHVAILVDRPLDSVRHLLLRIHPDVSVEANEVVLRNDAILMRRQILVVLINLGFDILRVDQRRMTLAEIYSEAVQ
jgi:ABC-2 type transport system ATP-binding protein